MLQQTLARGERRVSHQLCWAARAVLGFITARALTNEHGPQNPAPFQNPHALSTALTSAPRSINCRILSQSPSLAASIKPVAAGAGLAVASCGGVACGTQGALINALLHGSARPAPAQTLMRRISTLSPQTNAQRANYHAALMHQPITQCKSVEAHCNATRDRSKRKRRGSDAQAYAATNNTKKNSPLLLTQTVLDAAGTAGRASARNHKCAHATTSARCACARTWLVALLRAACLRRSSSTAVCPSSAAHCVGVLPACNAWHAANVRRRHAPVQRMQQQNMRAAPRRGQQIPARGERRVQCQQCSVARAVLG